jgi:hypothetical protein
MNTQRNSPGEAGNKLLWTGVAVVVVIVLAMGITLMRLQAQPQEPQPVTLPVEVPPSAAPPVVTGAASEAVISVTPLPPATTATDPFVDTPKPRIVQPRTSEPAVARAPQRVASKPDAVENETLPGVTR